MIVFNVFNACCLLHNLILWRKEVDVEELMQVIQIEAMHKDALNANGLQQNENNVYIKGISSREQHHHNLEVSLVVQCY
jgi:lipopolysaccharide biosynthesis glycosyltransferase